VANLKTEIQDKQDRIPEQFRPDAGTSLARAFETKVAALSGERDRGNDATDDIVFVDTEPTGHKTELDRRNAAVRVLSNKDNAERLASGADVLSGTIRDDMNGKASDRAKRQAEEKRRKARDADYMLRLQAEIVELERRIADYDLRIVDIEKRVFTPEERAMLDALPEEQRRQTADAMIRQRVADGKATQAEYEEWKRLQSARADAKAELADKQAEVSSLIAARERERGVVSVADASKDAETLKKIDDLVKKGSDTDAIERRVMTLEGLTSYDGPDRISKIDAFLETVDEVTLDALKLDDNIPDDLKVRIGILECHRQIALLSDCKGTPDYQMYVSEAVNDLPEAVRDALRNEPELSAELTTALYGSFSDTLDSSDKSKMTTDITAERNVDNTRKIESAPDAGSPAPI